MKPARRDRHRVAPDAADPAAQGPVAPPRPAQPPQDPGGRRRWSRSPGSQNLIEPGYNKPKNHKAGREWVELMVRLERPDGDRAQRRLRHRLVHRDRRDADRGRVRASRRSRTPEGVACQVVPSGPGFADENNLRAVQHADLRRPATALDHQPVLRARRVAAVRRHDGRPARRRGRAVRVSEEGDQFMVYHAQRSYYQALLEAGRADLPLPGAVRPALQALHRRRRRRGDRLEQHGHALLRAELRGVR